MSIKQQPKLLILIYAMLAVLVGTFASLLYLNPWVVDPPPVTLTCDAELAKSELARRQGKLDEAERLGLNAFKLVETGDYDFQRAKVQHALGLTYVEEKKLPQAEESFRKALSCLDRLIAKNSTVIANKPTLENLREAQQKYARIEGDLAALLFEVSRYSEAESAFKDALKKNDEYLGSLELTRTMTQNLAKVLMKEGKINESDELEIGLQANEMELKDLLGELKRLHEELDAKKIDLATATRSFKAIAIAASRKDQETPYMDAHWHLARANLDHHRIPEAKRNLEVIFAHNKAHKGTSNPDDLAIWETRALVLMAICCQLNHENEKAPQLLKQAASMNLGLFIDVLSFQLNVAVDNKLPYLQELLQLYQNVHLETYEKQPLKPEVRKKLVDLYQALAGTYAGLTQYSKAIEYYRRALDIYLANPSTHLQAALIFSSMSNLATQANNFVEAKQNCQQALATLAKIKPQSAKEAQEVSKQVSSELGQLAAVYNNLKDSANAELYYKKALENDLKSHHWQWLMVLGQYYQVRNKYKEAKDVYGRALSAYKTIPDTPKKTIDLVQSRYDDIPVFKTDPKASLLVQQGNNYLEQANLGQARNAFAESNKIISAKYGDDSLELAQNFRDIGDIYFHHDQFEEAIGSYDRVLTVFDNKHVHITPRTIFNQATSYLKRKNAEGKVADAKLAIVLLKRVIADIESRPDKFDERLLSLTYDRIGECYVWQKMYVEAEANYKMAVEFAEKDLKRAPVDPMRCMLATALKDLAVNYSVQKKFADAVPPFKRAIGIWEKVTAPPAWDHPREQLASTRILLADAVQQSKLNSTQQAIESSTVTK